MKKIVLLLAIGFLQVVTSQNKQYRVKKSNVNTNQTNFGVAFCSDDFVIYTSKIKKDKRRKDTDFYLGYLDEKGNIINSHRMNNDINSKFFEVDLVFTKDLKTVYFTRKTNYRRRDAHYELFKADVVTPGYWINIRPLWFNGDNYSVAHPCLSNDGKTLYFASDMPGGYGGLDLYKSIIYDDGKLGKPKNLGKRFNTIVDDTTPFVDENNVLYYASNGRAGYGGLDIYKVNLNDKSIPENVGKPINSSKDDYYYVERYNDNCGHFVSNRTSSEEDDIYYFEITNKEKLKKLHAIPFTEEERKEAYNRNQLSKNSKSSLKKQDKATLAKRRKELLGY